MTTASSSAAAKAPATVLQRRRGRPPGSPAVVRRAPSDQARRQAALILEVLAGTRTPTAAATALEVAPVRYYQIEARAIDGLVAACELRTCGRQPLSSEAVASSQRVKTLESDCQRLGGEVARLQALLRLNRLSLGVKPPPPPPVPVAGKRRARRPSVRALRVAQRTAPAVPSPGSPAGTTEPPVDTGRTTA